MKNKNIDILCVGEILIDFIGHQSDVLINNTRDYHRYIGGSPTNVAMNCSRLGLKAMIVGTVGSDGFSEYIFERLNSINVVTDNIKKLNAKPTSVVFVSKSKGTPDFIPFREADSFITEDQISKNVLQQSNIFHTTCFALSKEPAQSTILKKAEEAFNLGCKLSIDLNYAKKLWDTQEEAIRVIKTYCRFNPLIKISEDDMFRLFEKELTHQEIFEFFHNLGVDTVCLTLGENGVKLSQLEKNDYITRNKSKKVIDTTGAGDAFWSGFLYAYIKEKPIEDCLQIALKLAALKLQNVGRLPDNINILSKLL